MKSRIWRMAGVSILSLAMVGHVLADDSRGASAVMGGRGGNSQEGPGNGNQGQAAQRQGGQTRSSVQQGPQGAARQLGSSSAPRYQGSEQGGSWQGGSGHRAQEHAGGSQASTQQGPQGAARQLGRSTPRYQGSAQGGNWQGNQGGNWQGGQQSGNQWHSGYDKPRPGNGHGNGWGPGPQWRPGYRVNVIPSGHWRVPYGGVDYYYAEGYWYRPYGPSYIVVVPPRGIRVRSLPPYAREVWIGSVLYFLAAGTYYLWQADNREYVVANPPLSSVPADNSGGYDVIAYPARGQSQTQLERDRYDCHRWAVNESGFDPSQASYAPAPSVADRYRRALGACLSGRGYSVN